LYGGPAALLWPFGIGPCAEPPDLLPAYGRPGVAPLGSHPSQDMGLWYSATPTI